MTISCEAIGTPPPIILWTKDGRPIDFADNLWVFIETYQSVNNTLNQSFKYISPVFFHFKKTYMLIFYRHVSTSRSLTTISDLTIDSASTHDSGEYTCNVSNTAGSTHRNFNVAVYGNSLWTFTSQKIAVCSYDKDILQRHLPKTHLPTK